MVVTPERHATQVGLDVLRGGGNAVDAAVAVAFALAVTYPLAGNLGGGGFLLYRTPEARHEALDFRETAPRKLRPEMFLDPEGSPVPGRSLRSGLAVGVPGSVSGLAEAHRRRGSLSWARLLAPAIRLAEKGFTVDTTLARDFKRYLSVLSQHDDTKRIFTREGAALAAGDRLVQKDLAASLRRIARRGAAGFYEGPTAEALARTVAGLGGVLELDDLAGYRSVERQPIAGSYRGYRIVVFPPPSSGGIVLLQILGMLEPHDVAALGSGSSATVHLMVEAERRAYADRSRWLGDPDSFDVPVLMLLDPQYLSARFRSFRPDRATPSAQVAPGNPGRSESQDTLHFSIADPRGGAVVLTTTLNTAFGSGIVASGTGILLNNEMDDFALAPGVPNEYGLLGGEANAVGPGKRPLSAMTPTIVEFKEPRARPALVLGSPGGATIITSVLQVLVNTLDHGMPLQEAVDAARFHHQWLPDKIRHELRAFPADVVRALRERGHELAPDPEFLGDVQAIASDEDGMWLGADDPRRNGHAAGF